MTGHVVEHQTHFFRLSLLFPFRIFLRERGERERLAGAGTVTENLRSAKRRERRQLINCSSVVNTLQLII